MKQFDAIVVGAGPAGGHCARILSQKGHDVLLIERYKNFERNNFSSAGTPLETLSRFQLPDRLVGSYWQKLAIVTSNKSALWESEQTQGSVLDFAELKQFLADEVEANGGEVWFGCRYVEHHTLEPGQLMVTIKNNLSQETISVQTQVLVDATGATRAIVGRQGQSQPSLVTGTGVEYLISVDSETYKPYAETLAFLLGEKWMPRGYAWVFPMGNNRLKVGVGALNQSQTTNLAKGRSLTSYVERLIQEYLHPQDYQILDIHGETMRYSLGLQDVYSEGRAIAIGDTVSTINLLGGEGIRHAMTSAEVASGYIDEMIQGQRHDFQGYRQEMHRLFRRKWQISEKLALKMYLYNTDALIDLLVVKLNSLSLEQIVDLLFFYRFETLLYYRLKRFWTKLSQPILRFFGIERDIRK